MSQSDKKPFFKRLRKNFLRENKAIASRIERSWYSSKYPKPITGSAKWLVQTEMKYGGFVTGIERNKVSSNDPRTKEQILEGGMSGGDRMYDHLYARKYAKHLKPFVMEKKPITLVEVGILKGSGVAMWCELFPDSRIIGLDIDLGHIQNNMSYLKDKGAFQNYEPELYLFDQFEDNQKLIKDFLKGATIDVFIDDGFHSVESILTTITSVLPHLSKDFVYIIEDNEEVHTQLKLLYPNYLIDYSNRLTIITAKQ